MKNAEKLRQKLSETFEALESGEVDVQQAKVIVATSNAMLKSAQLEMEHSKMIGSVRAIKFLKTE